MTLETFQFGVFSQVSSMASYTQITPSKLLLFCWFWLLHCLPHFWFFWISPLFHSSLLLCLIHTWNKTVWFLLYLYLYLNGSVWISLLLVKFLLISNSYRVFFTHFNWVFFLLFLCAFHLYFLLQIWYRVLFSNGVVLFLDLKRVFPCSLPLSRGKYYNFSVFCQHKISNTFPIVFSPFEFGFFTLEVTFFLIAFIWIGLFTLFSWLISLYVCS